MLEPSDVFKLNYKFAWECLCILCDPFFSLLGIELLKCDNAFLLPKLLLSFVLLYLLYLEPYLFLDLLKSLLFFLLSILTRLFQVADVVT